MPERQANPDDVTALLSAAGQGSGTASEQLMALVYEELRLLAGSYLAAERQSHTLQPTALVHEAFLKLVGNREIAWEGRSHFFAVAAKAMRQILMNHARNRGTLKRGGLAQRVTLDQAVAPLSSAEVDLEALDQALTELERIDERQCRIVELRFFGGMSVDDTARVLDLSPRTVQLEWRMAKARLKTMLEPAKP
jgi:RNA polymerase sigma factor (TIGR02999 family)